MEGYYDLATPYLAANYTMNHLDLTSQFRDNISFARYQSGHMVYLNSTEHPKLKQDFANFIDASMPKGH
jgi:carboxypeptidase C (cathepsin A)